MPKTISLVVPDATFPDVIEGLCLKGNWLQTGDLENGNKTDFANKVLFDFVAGCVKEYKVQESSKDFEKQRQTAHERVVKKAETDTAGMAVRVA